jgi:hypothetical protein
MKFTLRTNKGKVQILPREKFVEYIEKEDRIFDLIPHESVKERRFFEGAVIPLATYFQEGRNYKDSDDRRIVRECLAQEFLPEYTMMNGKQYKTGGSTKGKLRDDLTERVISWLEEQYGIDRSACLYPEMYKDFMDRIYINGEYEDFIDYLFKTHRLPPKI